jgi:hypothetical protein
MFLVDRFWIDKANLVDDQALGGRLPEEAVCVAFVASRTGLIDQYEDAIGIAIDTHLDYALSVAAFLPFTP